MDSEPADKTHGLKDIRHFRVTLRGLEDYQSTFNFNSSELRQNARVLDVGSGVNQELRRELEEVRPDIKVFSIDPSLALPTKEEILKQMGIVYNIDNLRGNNVTTQKDREKRLKDRPRNVVAAVVPPFPYGDNTFDYIFDNHGAFLYLAPETETVKKYLKELLRVKRVGGTAYIFPLDHFCEAIDIASREMTYQQLLERSKARLSKVLGELGVQTYKFFEHGFSFSSEHPEIKRAGVKILK